MPVYEIKTTQEERAKVLKAIQTIGDETVPVHKIATVAGLQDSRARYALLDLIDEGKVERIPTKAFNKQYVRYKYKVKGDTNE